MLRVFSKIYHECPGISKQLCLHRKHCLIFKEWPNTQYREPNTLIPISPTFHLLLPLFIIRYYLLMLQIR